MRANVFDRETYDPFNGLKELLVVKTVMCDRFSLPQELRMINNRLVVRHATWLPTSEMDGLL